MQKSFILTASNNRRQLTFLIKTKKSADSLHIMIIN